MNRQARSRLLNLEAVIGVSREMMRKVLVNHLFGKFTNCDAEVSPRSEMQSLVALFYHGKFFKYLAGRSTFDTSHDFRWCDLRMSGNQYVDMVFTGNASQYFNLKPSADLTYQISDSHGEVALKNLVTVFRYP